MLLKKFQKFIDENYKNFVFRPQQKEAIEDIISAYEKNPNGVYFLDAPTGSGKSIIGMVFADFMAYQKRSGYILASDLSLHQQYVSDFIKYGLLNFSNVKGVDNYICDVNKEKFSTGDCKNRSINYTQAEKLPCYNSCGYLNARKSSIKSPITLLTYPYALIQRNYVEDMLGDDAPFDQRNFVVCDEAHKLIDIVQSHFSPILSYKTYDKLVKLLQELPALKIPNIKIDHDRFKLLIDYLFETEDKSELFQILRQIDLFLLDVVRPIEKVRKEAKKKYKKVEIPIEWKSVFRLFDYFKDVHCKVQDYVSIIKKTNVSKIVKNADSDSLIFNCIDDYYLLEKHFLGKFGFKILMTATMGKPEDFAETLGIKDYFYYKIDSNFDWSKSPINIYQKRRMSYKFLNENFDWLVKKLIELVRNHPNDSGIIHTASYDLTNRIWYVLPKDVKNRITIYKGSKEKEEGLTKMLSKKGQILMGPSLLEGLNLDEDKSRFQIFLKVPYPNINNKYVEAKMKHSQNWYNYKTVVGVLQGIGRSIRGPEDWAITYCLDACFVDLIHKSFDKFPKDFLERVVLQD